MRARIYVASWFLLFATVAILACSGPLPAPDKGQQNCPAEMQWFRGSCLFNDVVNFMQCTESRGVSKGSVDRTIDSLSGGVSVPYISVTVGAAAQRLQESIKVEQPGLNECSIIIGCGRLARAGELPCGQFPGAPPPPAPTGQPLAILASSTPTASPTPTAAATAAAPVTTATTSVGTVSPVGSTVPTATAVDTATASATAQKDPACVAQCVDSFAGQIAKCIHDACNYTSTADCRSKKCDGECRRAQGNPPAEGHWCSTSGDGYKWCHGDYCPQVPALRAQWCDNPAPLREACNEAASLRRKACENACGPSK